MTEHTDTGCQKHSIYNVAKNLYEGARMPNKEGHDYLYDNILTLIAPDTKGRL